MYLQRPVLTEFVDSRCDVVFQHADLDVAV